MPIEPPSCLYRFPNPKDLAEGEQIVGLGADFAPGTLLAAYRAGIFPWPHQDIVPWFSPDPRAVFPLDPDGHAEPRWSRSLRRTLRRHSYRVSLNEAFPSVVRACGAARSDGTWITEPLIHGYRELHRLGWAHSVEVWSGPQLVGGIYGVQVGASFTGESMFHAVTDASKIAFANLVERLRRGGFLLFDVQVLNPHLASLGCVEIARKEYLTRLDIASKQKASLA